MPLTYYRLLSSCTDDQLRTICERRKLPLPARWEEDPDGRVRLLKTMAYHLEDNRQLTNTLADLDSGRLRELKRLAAGEPEQDGAAVADLKALGLVIEDGGVRVVPERVADALEDFDDSALSFQAEDTAPLEAARPFGFALALTSVLLRCMSGLRILKGGLPAKKELGQLLNRNALLSEERDATLLFALLHRLGLLWSREGRVDTLLPAVLAQPPRWVAERAFAKLLEDDLKLWNMPPAEDRRFLLEHLLERRGQVLQVQPFLAFLRTLHPLDPERTRTVFLPFLRRMGLVAMDSAGDCVQLTAHGEALAQEYLFRDHRGTEAHWAPR